MRGGGNEDGSGGGGNDNGRDGERVNNDKRGDCWGQGGRRNSMSLPHHPTGPGRMPNDETPAAITDVRTREGWYPTISRSHSRRRSRVVEISILTSTPLRRRRAVVRLHGCQASGALTAPSQPLPYTPCPCLHILAAAHTRPPPPG
jgi:hypothetical protein